MKQTISLPLDGLWDPDCDTFPVRHSSDALLFRHGLDPHSYPRIPANLSCESLHICRRTRFMGQLLVNGGPYSPSK